MFASLSVFCCHDRKPEPGWCFEEKRLIVIHCLEVDKHMVRWPCPASARCVITRPKAEGQGRCAETARQGRLHFLSCFLYNIFYQIPFPSLHFLPLSIPTPFFASCVLFFHPPSPISVPARVWGKNHLLECGWPLGAQIPKENWLSLPAAVSCP